MTFRVWPLRFEFRAVTEVVIPPDKAGNVFRGAFGHLFRKIACQPGCTNAATCDAAHHCPYAQVFEPRWPDGPSGLADAPRAFVLRATGVEGRFAPGSHFAVDLHLFSGRPDLLSYFTLTFRQFLAEGVGVGRGKTELLRVTGPGAVLYANGRLLGDLGEGLSFHLSSPPIAHSAVVEFRTPTELKDAAAANSKPEFGILARRLANRVANLATLYQGAQWDFDFRAFSARADQVRLAESEIRWHSVQRLSSRTGQRHPLGGFVGWVRYEGDLGEFLPWLELGQWVGVGRQTVWGKGELAVKSIG